MMNILHNVNTLQKAFCIIPMKKNTSLVLATLGAIVAAPLFLVQPTWAEEETTQEDPIQEVNQVELEESRDEFDYTQGDYDQPISPLELIHRANLGGSRSMNDYRQDQQENFNDAAAQFRARQQELLRQQRQAEQINSPMVDEPEAISDEENLTETETEAEEN
jgi:hypothetical protein